MSTGFRVTNDNNSLLVDEEHPVFIVPDYSIHQSGVSFQQLSRQRESVGGDIYHWVYTGRFTVTLTIQFSYALISNQQPLLFLSQNTPAYTLYRAREYSANGRYYWGDNAKYIGNAPDELNSWMASIAYTPLGSPGHWTGISITISPIYEWSDAWRTGTTAQEIIAAVPDFRSLFLPAGGGASPVEGGHGVAVFDSAGRTVFNSNSNMLELRAISSSWTYSNRRGGSGTYYERWYSNCYATSPSDYCLVIPRQTYRRYNWETAMVGMLSPTGTTGSPWRVVVGGNSGSPVHTPVIWARPARAPWVVYL